MELVSPVSENFAHRILSVVEEVAQMVPIPVNQTSVVFRLESFSVAVMEVDPENFEGQEFSFNEDKDDVSFEMSEDATASLSIPQNLLMSVMDLMPSSEDMNASASIPRITNAAYLNDALFVRREERNDSVVGSIIIAATLSLTSTTGAVQNVRVEGLAPPITLVFTRDPAFENGTDNTCNFWDQSADGEWINSHDEQHFLKKMSVISEGGFGDWSTMNCYVVEDNGTVVVCACTHFTNFAILLASHSL